MGKRNIGAHVRRRAVLGAAAVAAVLAAAFGAWPAPVVWGAPAGTGWHMTAQTAPAPSSPAMPGNPGYGPGTPGYGPRFGPGYGPGFGPGSRFGQRRRGFGPRHVIVAGIFALGLFLGVLLLIALLVIAWKVITLPTLWNRPDGAIQTVRDRFARGEISEEEYRKRLAALS